MGNNRSNSRNSQRSLQNFIADPNFRANSQNIYANNTNAAAYPGAEHEDRSLAYSRKNVAPMTTQSTLAIKNDFLVEKNSVILVPTDRLGVFYLTFKFSSMTDVEVSIFYHGKDMIDDQQNTQYIYVDTKKYPAVKSFIFGPVRDQEFPALASTLDSKHYTKENLTKTVDGFYPLIIKMETKNDRVDLPKKILYTYFSLKYHNKKYEGKFLKQKLEVNKVSYILDDIYGIADSDVAGKASQDGKECTICMTNKVDTIVLPCKHMCLCLNCAKDLRDRRDSKCPMCRTTVENYLILKKS